MLIRCSDNSINIVLGSASEKEVELLFGADEPINTLHIDTKMPVVLREADLFKSSSAARNNGWDKEIPMGWSEWLIGKFKTKLFIFKNLPSIEEPVV